MSFCLEERLNWLYIDINSYFVTIEQQLNPEIRNKPVVVVPLLSDSTCAIAASYEAKKLGINTGSRIYEAKKIYPELICIKSRNDVYLEYHHKIFKEIDLYLHVDHIFSIDEGACRLTGKYTNQHEAILIAKEIKQAIIDHVGDYITCSIGIAPNRYLAKIASNIQKPNGLVTINASELPRKLYDLDLKSLPGVGRKTRERLISKGVSSVEDLCRLDRSRLKAIWGSVWGEKVWYLIRGADLPLEETKNPTIGHSQVLAPELQEPELSRNVLITLALKAASRLRSKNLYTNRILLAVEINSMNTIKETIKIELANDSSIILKQLLKAWDRLIRGGKIKKISVSFNNLQQESNQLTFEDLGKQRKRKKISKVLDYINKKLGKGMISIGMPAQKEEFKEVIAFSHIPDN